MIDLTTLTESDKGRKVIYRPNEIAPPQEGVITSWNGSYIFVDYQNVGWGQATLPSKLEFLTNI